jgi:hypothetical protein
MGLFEVRLEDPGSDEFRLTRIQAPDADTAREWCEAKEDKIVAFRIEDDEELATADKGTVFAHEQTEPYEVVSVAQSTWTPTRSSCC